MNKHILEIYQQMPASVQSWMATVRGHQLKRWRYNHDTDRLVEQALERDQWSQAEWQVWRDEQLSRLLERAAVSVPYYREQWSVRKRRGDRSSPAHLENWPILTKEAVRQHGRAFVDEDSGRQRLSAEDTSGTTGTPVCLWRTRDELVQWYALMEARWRGWYGITRHDRWGIIGGQRVVPTERSKPPFWVWNGASNQLYFSSLHLKPDLLSHYLDAIEKFSLQYLLGYASSLYWLAIHALESGRRLPLRVVLSNAEPLYDYQRDAITEAFQCPVRDTYGQGEKVAAMSECEHGVLHEWPEVGCLELLDDEDRPVPDGTLGRMVCTSLLTPTMPLIRYDIRDLASRAAHTDACSCGRSLPRIDEIVGRCDDTLVTPDGRPLPLLDVIFGPELHIHEAQIVQESLDEFLIRVVPAAGWCLRDEECLRESLRERAGDVQVAIECVPEIERTFAGKLRVLVSNVSRKAITKTERASVPNALSTY